jgi:hypothetical protein
MILDGSQPYGPSRPVTGIALTFTFKTETYSAINEYQGKWEIYLFQTAAVVCSMFHVHGRSQGVIMKLAGKQHEL